jgi:hypothetical protein
MIYNMPNLKYLYFENNQLTNVPSNAFVNVSALEIIDFSYNTLTTFELWALDVQTSANFSFNQISMITNTYFYELSQQYSLKVIRLTNNSVPLNLTDAVYEMYDSCTEVQEWLSSDDNLTAPTLTRLIELIDLGTTPISCSCNQYYLLKMFSASLGGLGNVTSVPLLNAKCTDGTLFQRYNCYNITNPENSSVNFSQVYPRLCKIDNSESGNLTTIPNISRPALNEVRYALT